MISDQKSKVAISTNLIIERIVQHLSTCQTEDNSLMSGDSGIALILLELGSSIPKYRHLEKTACFFLDKALSVL
jgi:hypothetical protein